MDKTQKALLGLACGDAFGAPFEYHSKASDMAVLSVKERRYLSPEDVAASPARARLPGLYTDDTQQALALLHIRTGDSGKDPKTAAARFLGMMREMARAKIPGTQFGSHRGTGINFRLAVSTGKPIPTAGLGAAMRVGPVATTFDDPQEMIEWVMTVSATTTKHPLGLAVAAKYASVAWALAHPERRREVRALRWPTDNVPPVAWDACDEALSIMRGRGEEALIYYGAQTGWANKQLRIAASGFGLTGWAWVVYHALASRDFEDALIRVCSSGGDTDTVGAMVGCLAALRHDIPDWLIDGLVGREHLQTWNPGVEKALTEQEVEFMADRTKPTDETSARDFFEVFQEHMEKEEQRKRIKALEPVLFGGRNDPPEFAPFSNFYICTFKLDGEVWRSTEHYYMAQKNPDDEAYQKAIRETLKPWKAKQLGRRVALREGWDDMKYDFMFRGVLAKFEQNPGLARLLLSTGDRPIHENRPDPWWGGGPNYPNGRDWLGKILMEVRSRLRGD